MCAMAFELHSIVIHRLYSRSFVSLPRREGRKALSLEKNEILYTCNLIKSTLALFRDQIYVNFINFSQFYMYVNRFVCNFCKESFIVPFCFRNERLIIQVSNLLENEKLR